MNKTVHRGVRYALMSCALSALAIPAAFAQSAATASASNQPSAGTQSRQTAPAKSVVGKKPTATRLAQATAAKRAAQKPAVIRVAQATPAPANSAPQAAAPLMQQLATVEITGTHILQSSAGAGAAHPEHLLRADCEVGLHDHLLGAAEHAPGRRIADLAGAVGQQQRRCNRNRPALPGRQPYVGAGQRPTLGAAVGRHRESERDPRVHDRACRCSPGRRIRGVWLRCHRGCREHHHEE